MQRLRRRLPLVRHHPLLLVACATAISAVAAVPADAQTHPYPLPSHSGYSQWYPYPYPILGFPPGAVLPDHIVAVRLQVTPREALVFVDGYAAGRVDEYDGMFQRLRLVPGPHEIVIYHPGLRTLRQNVYYNPGSTHTIRHNLDALLPGEAAEPQPIPRPMPPPPGASPPQGAAPGRDPSRTGALVLRVQPDEATVLIDGEPWKGPPSSDRLVIQLAEGSHRVRIEKPGFQPFAVDVDVRAGETTSFNVSLVP